MHATPKWHVPRRFSPRFQGPIGFPGVSGGSSFFCEAIADFASKEHMMPKLKTIIVIHTTSKEAHADSSADFWLEIGGPGDDVTVPFPKNPNQRQPGKLDIYQIDVSNRNVNSDAAGFSLIMTMKSRDGWLPTAISVLGRTADDELWLLGNHPFWDQGWFDSGDDSVGEPSHEISGETIFAG
jgi:hypothetical protein